MSATFLIINVLFISAHNLQDIKWIYNLINSKKLIKIITYHNVYE